MKTAQKQRETNRDAIFKPVGLSEASIQEEQEMDHEE